MNNQYLLFEKYVSDTLSKDTKLDFEKKLTNNLEFKEAFILYKEASIFLEQKNTNKEQKDNFTKNLSKISNQYFKNTKVSKKTKLFNFTKYGIAASLLIFLSTYLYQTNSTPEYADFVSYNAIDITVRSNQNQLVTKAENSFNTKEYKKAVNSLSQLLIITPKNTELQIYKAFSLIELNNFTEADLILEKISAGNSIYKNKAIWYLSLSKLKQKNYNSCRSILKKIPTDAFEYKKAKKLLSRLR